MEDLKQREITKMLARYYNGALTLTEINNSNWGDEVLVKLFRGDKENTALAALLTGRFEVWKGLFANDMNKKDFPSACVSFWKIMFIARSINSMELIQELYPSYIALADLYSTSMYWGSELHKDILFRAFFCLPATDEESYRLVENKVKEIFIKKIAGIILIDHSSTNEMPKFQEALIQDLKNMLVEKKTSLENIVVLIKKFMADSSSIFFRDNYITEKSYKVNRLKDLCEMIEPFIRPVMNSQEERAISQTRERSESIELMDMMLQLDRSPASVAAVQPAAQLVERQRRTESASVLQGVLPVAVPSAQEQEFVPEKHVFTNT